jgi:uncharacterized protein YbcI
MATTRPEPAHTPYGTGEQAAAISNALVRLHREHYGKGPTKAKTYLLEDVVLCVMHGGALRVEETLRDRGREGLVHDVRRAFQAALDDEFRGVIERETGRRVAVFLSQFDPEHNVGAEIFFLENGSVGADPS